MGFPLLWRRDLLADEAATFDVLGGAYPGLKIRLLENLLRSPPARWGA